ncbi:MAG: hypothetical protein AB7N70_04470 [Dehalococcoidia bacterium]
MAIDAPPPTGEPGGAAGGLRRSAVWLWDTLFGPPRMTYLADNHVTVKLLGRRFEASSPGALFDAVAHERERLVVQLGKMHEGAATKPLVAGARFSDSYHQQTRRIEDRIGFYSTFLGRLAKDLDLD